MSRPPLPPGPPRPPGAPPRPPGAPPPLPPGAKRLPPQAMPPQGGSYYPPGAAPGPGHAPVQPPPPQQQYANPPGNMPPQGQYNPSYPPAGPAYGEPNPYQQPPNRPYSNQGPYGHDGGRNYNDNPYHHHNNNNNYHHPQQQQHGGGGYGRGGYDGGYQRRGGRGGGDYRDPHQQQQPPNRREPTNTLWIGNLDISFQNDATLRGHLKEFGRIMQIATHFQKNFCFVHFRTVAEAQNAVDTLSRTRVLGDAHFNYGKMFEYSQEEMDLPYDPNNPEHTDPNRQSSFNGGGGGNNNNNYNDHRHHNHANNNNGRNFNHGGYEDRNKKQEIEPSNVLWVGGLPPDFTEEKLRDIFQFFGTITGIVRVERGNMAFITFETVEQCTAALETIRGKPVEGGVVLLLNYGTSRSAGNKLELDSRGVPLHETPTNVVYLGQLPSNVEESDLDELFSEFPGFIHCKLMHSSNIAFGHFDSIETATHARVALHERSIKGTPIRVSFGKQNHNYTMADKSRDANGGGNFLGGEGGDFDLDAMMRGPDDLNAQSGAMTIGSAGGSLALPAMGGGSKTPVPPEVTAYTKERPAPKLNLEAEQRSLMSLMYNNCGATGFELAPSQVNSIVGAVDRCTDASTGNHLKECIAQFMPLYGVHVFNMIAKRLSEFFKDDPHKKLFVLYACTHALLGAKTDYQFYSEAALNSYLMVLLSTSHGQTAQGVDRLCSILDSLATHPLLDKKAKVTDEYKESFRAQLKEIEVASKAEQDLASLLTRRKRR